MNSIKFVLILCEQPDNSFVIVLDMTNEIQTQTLYKS